LGVCKQRGESSGLVKLRRIKHNAKVILAPRAVLSALFSFMLIALVAVPVRAAYADDEFQPCPPPESQQSPTPPAPTGNPCQNKDKTAQPQKQGAPNNDRVFFVMPNFLTVENESQAKPLHWKEKFAITAKGVFDPYEFAVVGILAGIRQADNAYPAFGQGFVGYAKRYGTAMADQVDGNFMVGAVYPTILRTDPRYFQLGKGSFLHRTGYAISRIFVTRKDSGGHTFNFSESLGNGTAIAISNFYYPAADRGFSSSLDDWGVQMGIDALGNELKEFWPDLHRMIEHRRHRAAPSD